MLTRDRASEARLLACDKGLICCHGLLDDFSGIARGVMAFRGGASVIGGFLLVPFLMPFQFHVEGSVLSV